MVLSPLSVTPEWFYQGSMVLKQKKGKNVDSRLKISGMTDGVDSPLNFRHDERDARN